MTGHIFILVNTLNCRIWGPAKAKHSQVWFGQFFSKIQLEMPFKFGVDLGMVRPIIFKHFIGNAITVNGECYRNIISNIIWAKVRYELGQPLFSAVWNTMPRILSNFLFCAFGNLVISRLDDVNWPPQTNELNRLDCYLLCVVKDRCYAYNSEAVHSPKANHF